jgi:hypothetical protein
MLNALIESLNSIARAMHAWLQDSRNWNSPEEIYVAKALAYVDLARPINRL